MIVSKDTDMNNLSLVFGNPPKVIWLRLGNCSTLEVENLLRQEFSAIKLFVPVNNLLMAIDKNTKTKAGLRPATVFCVNQ
jgi:predicted nuclease of predicted toxin-antitoxin system